MAWHISKLSPFGPIFAKELRTTSRRKRSYMLRVLYLGGMLFFLFLANNATGNYGGAAQRAQQQAELGMIFFGCFAFFCVISMCLISPVLTSTAISSERLHKTLPVLMMTPISTWQIISGKLFSRLLVALTLIGLSLPVLAVVRLLGGVELGQMIGVICLATVMALTGAAIGLFFSTFLTRAYAVILLSYGSMMVFYAFLPTILSIFIFATGGSNTGMAWMYLLSSVNPMVTTMLLVTEGSTNFTVRWLPSLAWIPIWLPCVVVHLVLTTVLVFLTGVMLRRVGQRDTTPAPVATPIAAPPPVPITSIDNVEHVTYESAADSRYTGQVGDNPVLWRELRKPLVTRRWQKITSTTIVGLLLGFSYLALSSAHELKSPDAQIGYACVFYTVYWLLIIVLSATAIAQENESDTWTLLLTTPLSGRAIVRGKVLGLMRRMFWPLLIVAGHFLIFTLFGVINFASLFLILWVTISFTSVWIATGMYLSLRIPKVTFAVILNLLLAIILHIFVPLGMVILDEAFNTTRYGIHERLTKLTFWYQPYYFLTAIGNLTKSYSLWLPNSRDVLPSDYLMVVGLVGVAHLLISWAVLAYVAWRFDHLVGRCPQKSSADFSSPANLLPSSSI